MDPVASHPWITSAYSLAFRADYFFQSKSHMQTTPSSHNWRFFRCGGFDKVRIDTGADIANLDQLDPKLWVSLSCPTTGLEFDPAVLALIDADGDGRIRVQDVLATVRWLKDVLVSLDPVAKGAVELPLSAFNTATPAGKALVESARTVLSNLQKPNAPVITEADVASTEKIFAGTRFNGDGVVIPETAGDDAAMAQVISTIVSTIGGDKDLSGVMGVNTARVDAFLAQCASVAAWEKQGLEQASTLKPIGDATGAASAALLAVKAKVDDYFARCRLAAFDTRALQALNRAESEYLAIAAKDFDITASEVAHFPLASIAAGKALPLSVGVNPAWVDSIQVLRAAVVAPLLGSSKDSLSEAEWLQLCAKLAPWQAWNSAKPASPVAALGSEAIAKILAMPVKERIGVLIAKDLEEAPKVSGIVQVVKLLKLTAHFQTFLVNFINFKDFYASDQKAIFQTGELYLDGRCAELVFRVDDPGRHGALAGLSKCYLIYCDCVNKVTGDKRSIAAAFTNGDADMLLVGRQGVFYDRQGREYDATITKLVDNPISIRQAFWAPYKRVAKFVEDQIEKFAAAGDKAATDKAIGAVSTTAAPGAAPSTFDIAKFAGIFAAVGLAFGAIGSAIAAVVAGFLGLDWYMMPVAVAGALLVISGPSMLLAALKLRLRNVGPILEANGWAVNARARINIPFGKKLTEIAMLPEGAERSMVDPYAEKRSPWPYIIGFAVLLAVAGWAVLKYKPEWVGIDKVEAKSEAKKSPSFDSTPKKS